MIEVITKSRLASFSTCQRLHHLAYNLGYRSILPRELAEWGTLFHAGLDAWWGVFKDGDGPGAANIQPLPGLPLAAAMRAMETARAASAAIDDAAFAKAEVMMIAYDARWASTMSEWEVIGVEVEFITTIPGRRRLRVAGKLDKLLRKRSDGSIWFVEHKTTGADLTAGSTYWQRLRMDPQVSIYFGGVRSLGHEPTGCLYDVIVRPNLKPLKATPVEARKYTKDGRLYAKQREADETPEQFRARIAEEVAEVPDSYFARPEVVRLEREIEESERDVEATALQIRATAYAEHAPRNPGGCFPFGSGYQCQFFDVCSGVASLDDETKFERVSNVHQELAAVV